ncbi:MAG: hypothetical protein RI842_09320 [Schleiferiaceae bacterium]|nr:hypothetical protein [Schleiferiaceae bacterium]MDR9442909.1 hypothetical protein [Schleiferiaceae bacterium]
MRIALPLALASLLLLVLPWWIPALTPVLLLAFLPLLWAHRYHLPTALLPQTGVWMLCSLLVGLGWPLLVSLSWGGPTASTFKLGALLWLGLSSFHFIYHYLGAQRGYIALPFLWLSAMALPWYQGFAEQLPSLGAAFTGFLPFGKHLPLLGLLSATAWIWIVNILLFLILSSFQQHKEWKPLTGQLLLVSGVLILLPLWFSSGAADPAALAGPSAKGILPPEARKADLFVSRMSFFLAGFLLLFTLVRGYLKNKDPLS